MFFKFSLRINPVTRKQDRYFRLVEGLRDEYGKVKHRTLLNIGFFEDEFSIDHINSISRLLNNRFQRKQVYLFETPVEEKCVAYANKIWDELVSKKRIDPDLYSETSRKVDVDTMIHKEGKEIGAEWMCHQILVELGVEQLLLSQGFSIEQAKLAITQIISRAVYPASELRTSKWISDNSAVCELTGYDVNKMTKDKLYDSALRLYGVKTELEHHLSTKTNDLFNITDKILLYDLTNTYFEGQKHNSKLANFGRSKEKRSDAKIIVLALAVNALGFIKYHSIHEGNMSDTKNMKDVLEKMSKNINCDSPVVVIDAGIATEENLMLIQNKGYKYVCVSRASLKEYNYQKNRLTVSHQTKSKNEITLKALCAPGKKDFYMEVHSDAKELKERSMKNQFEQRFIAELEKAKHALTAKGGIKKYDKVVERITKIKGKYPSIARLYTVVITKDEQTQHASTISWTVIEKVYNKITDGLGKYFIRTNIAMIDELELWYIYNVIREIESTFRTLKTDLDLRPIYHKNDESTMAHLHLGLQAYWVVNTIRQKLKQQNIHTCWTEIVRIANTQKIVTTQGTNTAGKLIVVKKCTEPINELKLLYSALLMTPRPFRKTKSVVHKLTQKKLETQVYKQIREG
jgi:transposase